MSLPNEVPPGSPLTIGVYRSRSEICSACPKWKNRCGLGHILHSAYGCPLKKFQPFGNANFLKPAKITVLTWPDVLKKFAAAVLTWTASGMPLASKEEHTARFSKCQSCIHYQDFRCTKCFCFAYMKAKLATEQCPEKKWLRIEPLPEPPRRPEL